MNFTNTPYCLWVQTSPDIPLHEWQTALASELKWPKNLVLEKWYSSDMHWPQFLDSFNSITLFGQQKALIIFESEKVLKQIENLEKVVERLGKGPYFVVFHSELPLPAQLKIKEWKFLKAEDEKANDKSAFVWIDRIHQDQLTGAISALDEALESGQHPLALLQLITRDFRLGRLIHYASTARLSETELSSRLKIHSFIIQKWGKRAQLSKNQWNMIFDRLLEADLELKSGAEGVWVLRKLTFDLVLLTQGQSKLRVTKRIKRPLKPEPLLWTISPSFA